MAEVCAGSAASTQVLIEYGRRMDLQVRAAILDLMTEAQIRAAYLGLALCLDSGKIVHFQLHVGCTLVGALGASCMSPSSVPLLCALTCVVISFWLLCAWSCFSCRVLSCLLCSRRQDRAFLSKCRGLGSAPTAARVTQRERHWHPGSTTPSSLIGGCGCTQAGADLATSVPALNAHPTDFIIGFS